MNNQLAFITFLNLYAGATYHAPPKITDPDAKAAYETIFTESKKAISSFHEYLYSLGSACNMVSIPHKGFLDGSNIKVRNYMWGELRDISCISIPESISIFAEKSTKDTYTNLRISLEIDERRSDPHSIKLHNDSITSASLPSGFIYGLNQTSTKNMYFTENLSEAKQQLLTTYKKIQICKILDVQSMNRQRLQDSTINAIIQLYPLYSKITKHYK